MRTVVKMKYCKVAFDEHYNQQEKNMEYWSTVDFAWGEKENPMALAFSQVMDHRIRDKARSILIPLLKCEARDIELEDTWLMVQGYKSEAKHHTARLLGIVAEAEREFDEMVSKN